MRGKWFLAISLAVILCGALAGTWFVLRKKSPASASARSSGALTLAPGSISTVTGLIRPQHVVAVGSSSQGMIDAFLAEAGQEVFEGDTLARITSRSEEAAVENASNALERSQALVDKAQATVNNALLEQSRANADVERSRAAYEAAQQRAATAQNQYKYQAISRNAYDAAQQAQAAALADYQRKHQTLNTAIDYEMGLEKLVESEKKALAEKQRELDSAKDDLNASDVLAPVSGWVVSRNGQAGQAAQEAGNQMFVIATDFAVMEVVVEPEPPILKRLVPGMPALVLIPELTDAALSGDIKAIENNQVIVQFDNPLPALKAGMRGSVHFKLD